MLQGVGLGTLLAVWRVCSGNGDPAPHHLEFLSSGSTFDSQYCVNYYTIAK